MKKWRIYQRQFISLLALIEGKSSLAVRTFSHFIYKQTSFLRK